MGVVLGAVFGVDGFTVPDFGIVTLGVTLGVMLALGAIDTLGVTIADVCIIPLPIINIIDNAVAIILLIFMMFLYLVKFNDLSI